MTTLQVEALELPAADCSFAVAFMPEREFAADLSRASLAISSRFENGNVIDEDRYPAHLSLHLSGVAKGRLPDMMDAVQRVAEKTGAVQSIASRLYTGRRGFLGVHCEIDGAVRALHDDVIRACTEVHMSAPVCRPHLLARWNKLRSDERELIAAHGSYKVFDRFEAHFSVAQVAPEVLADAAEIARGILTFPRTFVARSIQFVDIGHENERWEVLREWPLSARVG